MVRRLSGTESIVYGGLVVGGLDALDGIVFFGFRCASPGGLVVGALAALDAIVFFGFRGATPVRIFQSIAAGLLGRATFQGGLRSALLGVAIHFFIAFSIAATYYAASRRLSILTQRPIICGAAYGVLVYFFMNRVVIPLSAIGGGAAPPLPVFI